MKHAHSANAVRIIWIVSLAALAVFVLIAAAVTLGLTDAFDRSVLLALREPGNPSDPIGPQWFEETALEITALGGYPVLTLFAALVCGGLLLLQKPAAALFLAIALGGGSGVSASLKHMFARARPDLVQPLDHTVTSSFPSGHATVSMLAWLTVAAILVRFVPRRAFRIYCLVGALSLALAIGMSRVYLGVHWPSDVAAGWALGIAWAGVCWLGAHYIAAASDHAEPLGTDIPELESAESGQNA